MIALLVAAIFATVFTLLLTPLFARVFRRMRLGQFIRADTPTTHVVKRGTPSMGGVVFITGSVLGYFVGKLVSAVVGNTISTPEITPAALLVIFLMVTTGAVGFLDDFLKVRKRNSLGLRGWWKILLVAIASVMFCVIGLTAVDFDGLHPVSTSLSLVRDIPGFDFSSLLNPVLGAIVATLIVIVITLSTTNAVNLTDGLDGLAAGASVFAIGAYIIIGFWQYQQSCSAARLDRLLPENVPKCYTVSDPLDLATIAAAIVGSLIGFLWWNTNPAQIHMGDTGSFGLGGALAALAVLSRTELLLVLIAGLFIIGPFTVITQRTYFRLTHGKRIWRASPLHHHFEMVGWAEVTIVVRFWLIAGLLVAGGVGLFYLEWLSR